MSEIVVAPNVRDLDDLAASLTDWLESRLPGAKDLRISGMRYPSGAGQSHETILFDADWVEDGNSHSLGCVVRIKPSSFAIYPDDLFTEQYGVMRVLHESRAVRVAQPLWFEEDPSLLGQPFFVMKKAHGRVPVSVPPYATVGWLFDETADRRRHAWASAVEQLAAIQSVPLAQLRFLGGPEGARDGLAQEFDKYTRFVDWLRPDPRAEILAAGRRRLLSSWPANQPEGLVWGDARIGNMMFDENLDVVAVMDWEQPSLGGALHDLAWFITLADTMHGAKAPHGVSLEGMGSREETIAMWEELTGKSADDIEWYEDFTRLKMSCLGVRMAILRNSPGTTAEELAVRLKVA